MSHTISPHTSFQDRSESEEDAKENGKNDEENAGAGVLALRGRCPGNRVERGFE